MLTKTTMTKPGWISHSIMRVTSSIQKVEFPWVCKEMIGFWDTVSLKDKRTCGRGKPFAKASILTEHSSSRHRLSVQPERHLGENDGHDARQVRLNDKVADFPLQMEMSRHHRVFTCGDKIQGYFKATLQQPLILPFRIWHLTTFNYLMHHVNTLSSFGCENWPPTLNVYQGTELSFVCL